MAKTLKGRKSIFRGKKGGMRVQGIITKIGAAKFREARARLANLVDWKVRDVSKADVIEYLARGHDATVDYLTPKQSAGRKLKRFVAKLL